MFLVVSWVPKAFGETSNHPGDSAPVEPRFGNPWLLAFPKTKVTFEREEISDHQWDSGKYDRAADGNWENRHKTKFFLQRKFYMFFQNEVKIHHMQ